MLTVGGRNGERGGNIQPSGVRGPATVGCAPIDGLHDELC